MKGESSIEESAAAAAHIEDLINDKNRLDRLTTSDENQQLVAIDETGGNSSNNLSMDVSKSGKGSIASGAAVAAQTLQPPAQLPSTTTMMAVGGKHILPRPQGLNTLATASNGSMAMSASSLNGSFANGGIERATSNRQRRSSVSTSNSANSNGAGPAKRSSNSSSADLQDSSGNSQQPFCNPQYTGCRYDVAKPPYSYASLIAQALLAAPQRKLTLNQIYQWIMEKYPYYHSENSGWQNSIRHNLSLNSCFVKLAKSEKDHVGKGAFWTINEEEIDMLNNGTFKRRKLTGADGTSKSRRKRRGSSSANASLREKSGSTSNQSSSNRQVDEYGLVSGLSGGDLSGSYPFGVTGHYGGDRFSYYTHPEASGLSGPHAAGAAYGPMARSITDWEGDFPADLDIIESVLGRPVSSASTRKQAAHQNSSSSLAALPTVNFDGHNNFGPNSGLLHHGLRRHEEASSSSSLMAGQAKSSGASWSGVFSQSKQHISINDPQTNGAFAHMRHEDISRAFLAATTLNQSMSRNGSVANVNECSMTGVAHHAGMYNMTDGSALMQPMGLQSTEDLASMMASNGNMNATSHHPGASVYSMQSASHHNVLQQSPSLQSIQQSLFNHPMSNGPMPSTFSHHQLGSANAASAGGVLAPPSSTLWELQRSAAEVRTDQTDPLEYFG